MIDTDRELLAKYLELVARPYFFPSERMARDQAAFVLALLNNTPPTNPRLRGLYEEYHAEKPLVEGVRGAEAPGPVSDNRADGD